MTEQESIKTEVARAMCRAHPPMIMTLEDVAHFTGHSYNYVRNELQYTEGFPPRLDRFKQPRWSRDSICEWAQVSTQ